MAVELLVVQLVLASQSEKGVDLIGLHTVLSAVIQHGMSMALIVQRLNLTMDGIVQDATALVIMVVMVAQLVEQPVVAIAPQEQLKIVTAQVNVMQNHGLETVYVMVMTRHGARTFVAMIMMAVTVRMLNVQTVKMTVR